MSNTSGTNKRWLRDASMQRLSTFMKNKTEQIGNASQLGIGSIVADELEKSGLNAVEIYHLEQWVSENFLCDSGYVYETVFKRPPSSVIREALQMLSSRAFEKNALSLNVNQINIAIKQLRLDNLGALPQHILRNKVASEESSEKDQQSMDKENCATDNINSTSTTDDNKADDVRKVAASAAGSVVDVEAAPRSSSESIFRLQIMIELIRMHVISHNRKVEPPAKNLPASAKASAEEKSFSLPTWADDPDDSSSSVDDSDGGSSDSDSDSDSSLDELFEGLPEFIKTELNLHRRSKTKSAKKPKVPTKSNLFSTIAGKSAEAASSSSSSSFTRDLDAKGRLGIDLATIETHLNMPLQRAMEGAEALSNEDIERLNALLKPYLKQMAGLKATLTIQLKELQESRAYLSLGISPDASDALIKKAYRAMAIKLHPDKPGGDTAKFQQLQDHYQEIMAKRKHAKEREQDLEEVQRARRQPPPPPHRNTASGGNASKKAAKTPKHEDEEDSGVDSSDDEYMGRAALSDDEGKDEVDGEENESQPLPEKVRNKGTKPAPARAEEKQPRDSDDDTLSEEESAGGHGDEQRDSISGDDDEEVEDVQLSDAEDDEDGADRPADIDREVDLMMRSAANSEGPAAVGATALNNEEYVSGKKQKIRSKIQPSYSTPEEHGYAIAESIHELLLLIKESAHEITTLAQRNFKLQKNILRAGAKLQHPANIQEIMKYITGTAVSPSSEAVTSIDSCSLYGAIGPIELICELTQNICSLAMKLPNICDQYYAKHVANNSTFMSTIENTMNTSLNTLKTVMQCITSTEQCNSALRRVKDSYSLACENKEICALLLEMINTSLKSNILTITNAVDKIVESALNASHIHEMVVATIQDTERHVQSEVRRKAAQREHEEAENDYTEEDKELLRQSRASRQQEESDNRRNAEKQQGGEGAAKGAADDNEEDDGAKSLTELKDKIRLLQIQLRMQHINSLQTINKEIVALQASIVAEIKGLPFISSWDALFRQSSAAKTSDKKSATKTTTDYHTSLMSLLADFVDSSCMSLKADVAASRSNAGTRRHRKQLSNRDLLHKNLGWMSIVLADGSYDLYSASIDKKLFPEETLGEEGVGDEASGQPTTVPTSSTMKMRLALLPDYKAKTLYLASLVDMATVRDIVATELLQRVEEIFFEGAVDKAVTAPLLNTFMAVSAVATQLTASQDPPSSSSRTNSTNPVSSPGETDALPVAPSAANKSGADVCDTPADEGRMSPDEAAEEVQEGQQDHELYDIDFSN